MKKLLIVLLSSIGFLAMGSTQAQQAAEPCGPAGDLSADYSNNVADNSRCFEIRMYTAQPDADGDNGIDDLHQRFREEEVAIFERLGAQVIAVWQRLDNPDTLVWMLAYRNRAHRQEVWDAFRTDPAWLALREKYPVRVSAEVYFMGATDYSRLR